MFERFDSVAARVIVTLLIACVTSAASAAERPRERQGSNATGSTGASDTFTHIIAREAEYYTTGPQQGRPPDGRFPAGTKVNVLKQAGSYVLVQAENGVRAYVAANALKEVPAMTEEVSTFVEGENRFALELYAQLRSGDGNLFFSPSSISVALAMTYAGAEGGTEKEMASTLHFGANKSELNDAVQFLLTSWQSSDPKAGYHLHVANRLWGEESYRFLPQYLEVTRTKYGAELARLDFVGNPEGARNTINHWVEEQTQNKITDLLPPGTIRNDTRLVLTNAVYFKGDWAEKFEKRQTKDEDFHVNAANKVKAPLMHQTERFRYVAVDGLQVLELPYGNKSLSMIAILPDKIDGLPDLETRFSHENLQKWMSALRSREVEVYLPRFKTTASFELSDTLRAMGMPSAFDPTTADFAGMTGNQDLSISNVVHKAFVDVNEEGTEAAAATGVTMVLAAAPPPMQKPVFRADHPFVFLIRDNRNGAILFLGRLLNPNG